MHVENFKLNYDGNGSVQVQISKKELLFLLDVHYYFCHVFQHVLLEKFDHSFNITPRQIKKMKFLLVDIIHPFKEKLPNRFTKMQPRSYENNTVIGMYMKAKFSDSNKYRSNLVYAMKQDVLEWNLRFQIDG